MHGMERPKVFISFHRSRARAFRWVLFHILTVHFSLARLRSRWSKEAKKHSTIYCSSEMGKAHDRERDTKTSSFYELLESFLCTWNKLTFFWPSIIGLLTSFRVEMSIWFALFDKARNRRFYGTLIVLRLTVECIVIDVKWTSSRKLLSVTFYELELFFPQKISSSILEKKRNPLSETRQKKEFCNAKPQQHYHLSLITIIRRRCPYFLSRVAIRSTVNLYILILF